MRGKELREILDLLRKQNADEINYLCLHLGVEADSVKEYIASAMTNYELELEYLRSSTFCCLMDFMYSNCGFFKNRELYIRALDRL